MSLVDGAYALITSPVRNIGGIIPDIVIEEVPTDALRVTDHPVEVGATVSDHAFKLPCEIIMRCGWSDASGGFEGYSAAIYATILDLQASREPFSLSTGKRQYQNMLISLVTAPNDEATEHALVATIGLREVILTYTEQSGAGAGNQTNAKQTAAPTNRGSVQLQPAKGLSPTFADGHYSFSFLE